MNKLEEIEHYRKAFEQIITEQFYTRMAEKLGIDMSKFMIEVGEDELPVEDTCFIKSFLISDETLNSKVFD